jgi:hypothetical protein
MDGVYQRISRKGSAAYGLMSRQLLVFLGVAELGMRAIYVCLLRTTLACGSIVVVDFANADTGHVADSGIATRTNRGSSEQPEVVFDTVHAFDKASFDRACQ